MKLRIKGDSLRLRVGPAEMARLMETGRIEETIHFGLEDDARLTYALEVAGVDAMTVRHEGMRVAVVLPMASARDWAQGNDVGVYGRVGLRSGWLEIAVEKDWACLDKRDGEKADTFPNPKQGELLRGCADIVSGEGRTPSGSIEFEKDGSVVGGLVFRAGSAVDLAGTGARGQ
jgi:hypothetical protein